MYPKVASSVPFQRHMVVVRRDGCLPTQPGTENRFHQRAHFHCHCSPTLICEAPRPDDVLQIHCAVLVGGVERAQPAADGLGTSEMMVADCRANPSGSTMDHQPEVTIFIALELDEVVSASERRELENAVGAANHVQARVTQRRSHDV